MIDLEKLISIRTDRDAQFLATIYLDDEDYERLAALSFYQQERVPRSYLDRSPFVVSTIPDGFSFL
jgi:hypothetical protein